MHLPEGCPTSAGGIQSPYRLYGGVTKYTNSTSAKVVSGFVFSCARSLTSTLDPGFFLACAEFWFYIVVVLGVQF